MCRFNKPTHIVLQYSFTPQSVFNLSKRHFCSISKYRFISFKFRHLWGIINNLLKELNPIFTTCCYLLNRKSINRYKIHNLTFFRPQMSLILIQMESFNKKIIHAHVISLNSRRKIITHFLEYLLRESEPYLIRTFKKLFQKELLPHSVTNTFYFNISANPTYCFKKFFHKHLFLFL